MKILVVDDHEMLAESLRLALSADGHEVVVPPVAPDAIYQAAQELQPDVVLLDLDLGETGGDGSMLVEALALGGAKVVVVTGTTDRLRIASCLESGACGYVAKAAGLGELLNAIARASTGEPLMADACRQDMLTELRRAREERRRELAPFEQLTPRERYVLAQVSDGRSAAEIAQSSYVSEATVRTQIRAVLSKLGVSSQLAAVAAARRAGWESESVAD